MLTLPFDIGTLSQTHGLDWGVGSRTAHLMLAGLKAGAMPLRTKLQLSSVNPVTKSG